MASPKIPTPVMVPSRTAHYVDFSGPEQHVKEEIRFTFLTSWRGQAAMVTMEASRYTTADGRLTEWRIFADQARAWTPAAPPEGCPPNPMHGYAGEDLTSTARVALGDACSPLVRDWLGSDAFYRSRREAFATRIKGLLGRARIDLERPAVDARRALERYAAGELSLADARHLWGLCDAIDAVSEKLRAPLPTEGA